YIVQSVDDAYTERPRIAKSTILDSVNNLVLHDTRVARRFKLGINHLESVIQLILQIRRIQWRFPQRVIAVLIDNRNRLLKVQQVEIRDRQLSLPLIKPQIFG